MSTAPASAQDLLTRFLSQEATIAVRTLLLQTLADGQENLEIEQRTFDFNTHDVRINFTTRTVTIADVLSQDAEASLPIEQFADALQRLQFAP